MAAVSPAGPPPMIRQSRSARVTGGLALAECEGSEVSFLIRLVYTFSTGYILVKTTKTFKSGNSVAVRLPKALGVAAGIEMRVREESGRYVIEPVEQPRKIDLTGIAGAIPGLKPLSREER